MYENENERKIYPLPLKVKTQKSLRMFLCGLFVFALACGMVIFSCYMIVNAIELGTINELDDLVFFNRNVSSWNKYVLLPFAISFNC